MHRILSVVPSEDLLDPPLRRREFSIRSHHQVEQRQGIQVVAVWGWQPTQLVHEAALRRLISRAGVMGHERNNPRRDALALQESSAVQRMKARPRNRRRVADIMQPRGGQHLCRHHALYRQSLGEMTDALDMFPATAGITKMTSCQL